MPAPKCLVFPDGDDWIVFAPKSRIVMRTNAAAAIKFHDLRDHGPDPAAMPPDIHDQHMFAPVYVTISCSNMCANRCVYCYGTPAHLNRETIDPDFCRVGLEFIGTNARARNEKIHAFFHGVGEPTYVWPLFTECVDIVREAGSRFGTGAILNLCTGGQLDENRARWIAENIDEVQVSLDGPEDLQNQQRPRADGRDSLEGPLRLAQLVKAAGKKLAIKTTVTNIGVHRMVEIVEFIAREIGSTYIQFGMMFAPEWVRHERICPPHWKNFVEGFEQGLRRGRELGVCVRHGTISFRTLITAGNSSISNHFCLAPNNVVTLFYDVPHERSAGPQLGVYGWYDAASKSIHFDHEKRLRLRNEELLPECQDCPCFFACSAPGGVKGRMPKETPVLGPTCQARLGLLKALLRSAVPPRDFRQEVRT